ncbi:transmembrane protein, putative [Entamoeba invadens IP1]|uniref:ER membrane protein complex subunit 3 n=1 Tax=Entamoeba invadens IP1 TaxID=370355 RepID=A0A0A1U461_ENTIV|nr:transmembrane protein, putative [Entamoeba invadens IP1]ELP87498.1 transmembrane protein, putative [Entamoeba invadens IP1]|eukprot:XP_004254269.1 transmembrane protein, putative [Entamoeba invadens IP1]
MDFILKNESFLTLSTEIRDWVLIPLFVVTVCSNYIRQYLMVLIGGGDAPTPRSQQENSLIQRVQIFIDRSYLLFNSSFKRLRDKYTNPDNGLLIVTKAPTEDGIPNMPQADPSSLMGGMKGNLVNMVIQIVLMTWITSMFDGFIVLKVPFPLSYRFKLITQQGMGFLDIDVSYVSSISWYILVFAGGRYIMKLFDSDNDMDMSGMTGMPTGQKAPSLNMSGVVGQFNDLAKQVALVDPNEDNYIENIYDKVAEDLNIKINKKKNELGPVKAKKD